MGVLYIALPVALIVAAGFVVAFVWAVRSGQFDDTQTPAIRILHEEEPVEPTDRARGEPPART